MTMHNATTTATADELNAGAMLKDYMRDCRFGFCNHAACQRKAAARFADTTAVDTDETENEGDFDPGFDIGATAKDVMREQRIERILGIGRGLNRRRSRTARRSVPSTPVFLTEDGRLDKQAMREDRLFGRQPLYV